MKIKRYPKYCDPKAIEELNKREEEELNRIKAKAAKLTPQQEKDIRTRVEKEMMTVVGDECLAGKEFSRFLKRMGLMIKYLDENESVDAPKELNI